jgi:hypothetical protein
MMICEVRSVLNELVVSDTRTDNRRLIRGILPDSQGIRKYALAGGDQTFFNALTCWQVEIL